MTNEEWRALVALRKTKRNLAERQKRLVLKLRRSRKAFKADSGLQTELRRVANLCMKLEQPLHHLLGVVLVEEVMTC